MATATAPAASLPIVQRIVERLVAVARDRARRFGHSCVTLTHADVLGVQELSSQPTLWPHVVAFLQNPPVGTGGPSPALPAQLLELLVSSQHPPAYRNPAPAMRVGLGARNVHEQERQLLQVTQGQPQPLNVCLHPVSLSDVQTGRDLETVADLVIQHGALGVTVAGLRANQQVDRKRALSAALVKRGLTDPVMHPRYLSIDQVERHVPADQRQVLIIDQAHALGTAEHGLWVHLAAREVVLVGCPAMLPVSTGLALVHLWPAEALLATSPATLRTAALALLASPGAEWLRTKGTVRRTMVEAIRALTTTPPGGQLLATCGADHPYLTSLRRTQPLLFNTVRTISVHELILLRGARLTSPRLLLLDTEVQNFTLHEWLALLVGGWDMPWCLVSYKTGASTHGGATPASVVDMMQLMLHAPHVPRETTLTRL